MSNPVIFKELPATFPVKDRFQKPSLVGALVFHAVLLSLALLIPLMFPGEIERLRLMAILVAPPPPPPPPPPAPTDLVAIAKPAAKEVPQPIVDAGTLVSPVTIPKDIARIIDEPMVGVPGGVIGGMPGGVSNGILNSVLSANLRLAETVAPPPPPPVAAPPPPPAPHAPVRVGGDVKEPKPLRIVPPVYPTLAVKARVDGTVVLEATITVEGAVDEIRVVSGHPLLIRAAIDCLKQWKYEPSYLNGDPVPVILTARIVFHQKTTL